MMLDSRSHRAMVGFHAASRRGVVEGKRARGGRLGRSWTKAVVLLVATLAAVATTLETAMTTTLFLRLQQELSTTLPPAPPPPPPALGHGGIENDGLVWNTPKPGRTRRVGWEDDWMMDWKRRKYSVDDPNRGCRRMPDTPYDDGRVCFVPSYVPARLYAPEEDKPGEPNIPRVIFVTLENRRVSLKKYTALMTLLHHNPEYELVQFDDDDMDRFVCSHEGDFALDDFSKIRAGAMRADVWRLLIIQRYGGVYVDGDMSAVAPLPIRPGDTSVSGVGGWYHLPGETGGVLEHWAMAFMPRHPYINAAVEATKANLDNPTYLLRDDTPEAKAERSETMRLTGPAMYQKVLHDALAFRCRKVDHSYVPALLDPEAHCNVDEFRKVFPAGARMLPEVNLGGALVHKVFSEPVRLGTFRYDAAQLRILEKGIPGFCDEGALEERAAEREREWKRRIEEAGEEEQLDRIVAWLNNLEENQKGAGDDDHGAESGPRAEDELDVELDRHLQLANELEKNEVGDDDELGAELDRHLKLANELETNRHVEDELELELGRYIKLANEPEKNGVEDDDELGADLDQHLKKLTIHELENKLRRGG
ncbi:hypothetical protein ACHAWF_012500 [Thalassiosira exigua]